jgi:hypothetical protein
VLEATLITSTGVLSRGFHTSAEPQPDKPLARLQATLQHLNLLGELVALGTYLFGFSSNARDLIGRHLKDRDRGQDGIQGRDQFGLNNLNSYIIDETLQRNLVLHE